ncbi:hypothetical protein UT300018_28180 [Clostridium faecium]
MVADFAVKVVNIETLKLLIIKTVFMTVFIICNIKKHIREVSHEKIPFSK